MVYEIGSRVFIFGLKNHVDLNGSLGTIVSHNENERIGVQLLEKTVSVRKNNLPFSVMANPLKGNCLVSNHSFKDDETLFTEELFLHGPKFIEGSGIKEWKPLLNSLTEEKFNLLCTLSDDVTATVQLQIARKIDRDAKSEPLAVLRMAEKLMRVFEVNCFNDMNGGRGVYYATSFINHSCTPNAQRNLPNGVWTVTAVGDILPGDEINISYVVRDFIFRSTRSRQADLFGNWGFLCNCPYCQTGSEASSRELIDTLSFQIFTGFASEDTMMKNYSEVKVWLDKNYPYPMKQHILQDLLNGIGNAKNSLVSSVSNNCSSF